MCCVDEGLGCGSERGDAQCPSAEKNELKHAPLETIGTKTTTCERAVLQLCVGRHAMFNAKRDCSSDFARRGYIALLHS